LITMLFGLSFVFVPIVLHKYKFDSSVRMVLPFLPTLLFIFFIIRFVMVMKSYDELERRIHHEALSYSLVILFFLNMIRYSLALAFPDTEEVSFIPADLIYLTFLYPLGILISRRRYT
jgi:hypothetical protein